MIAATIMMTVIALFAMVVVAAVNGDNRLTRRDLEQKRAYEAAKAGINDYAYHLTANPGYWAECTEVALPNAVNQKGKITRTRPVPGETGASYAIELLPAVGNECNPKTPETATKTMLETKELSHSFRIRSVGYAGEAKASIVATFQPPSFLDYVYFTHRETLDPSTYNFPAGSAKLKAAEEQCKEPYQGSEGLKNGRMAKPFYESGREREYCSVISFVTGDYIKGPLRSDDAIVINGHPVFGRGPEDEVELHAKAPGWYSLNESSSDSPVFKGAFKTSVEEFTKPESNTELEQIALSQFVYSGQVKICLSEESMTVGKNGTCTGLYSGAIPSNGVIYVKGSGTCETYSPFTAAYPETSGCGNVYVKGEYSGELTIAAQNSVIINGSLTRKSGSTGTLGLIANNFIRVYHPCEGNSNLTGSMKNPTIEAAMLALQHSFIVDHYDCGAPLGTLKVVGAIAQNFRGPVGEGGSSPSSGYLKNYEYDDRLQYQEPPYFLKPKTESWVIGRETTG